MCGAPQTERVCCAACHAVLSAVSRVGALHCSVRRAGVCCADWCRCVCGWCGVVLIVFAWSVRCVVWLAAAAAGVLCTEQCVSE